VLHNAIRFDSEGKLQGIMKVETVPTPADFPSNRGRLAKVHSTACRALPKSDRIWKKLDSSMSSDALLMNIFCYSGITKRKELSSFLGTGFGDLPEFGFKPCIPLTSGFVERTEIDMKLGSVLFEAKLTAVDFQTRMPRSSKDIEI
jgi:hypothetical protein